MADLQGRNVLITGGSGSFGRAFLQRARELNPQKVIIVARNEYGLWQTREKFTGQGPYEFALGDVRDRDRMTELMSGVDLVIHAAALKHIDFCEQNPTEAYLTNIIGTKNVVAAARQNGVKQLIHLSTDKAVNATSVYGASKLIAERLVSGAGGWSLRYSNVISSHGAVFEKFRDKISRNEPIELFSSNMERYFVTQAQVIDLLLKSIQTARGRETFLLAPPKVKIEDLANEMIRFQKSQSQVTISRSARAGEKESAVLVTHEELARLYHFTGDQYVVIPGEYQPSIEPVLPEIWAAQSNRYATQAEIKQLIEMGKQEL